MNHTCSKCRQVKPESEFWKSDLKGHKYWCRKCHSAINGTYQKTHRNLVNSLIRNRRLRVRLGTLKHYSNDKLECACCGYKTVELLQIDHVHNDGNVHRKSTNNYLIYDWLKSRGYPSGYQVLCPTCNWAKRLGIACHGRVL